MVNKIIELAEKRKKQSDLARKIGANIYRLNQMSDHDVRCHNLASERDPLSLEVKGGINFGEIYSFAVEYNDKNNKNILNEKIEEKGHTLFWSASTMQDLIKSRMMTQAQYNCCEKVADMMLSGSYKSYNSVKYR